MTNVQEENYGTWTLYEERREGRKWVHFGGSPMVSSEKVAMAGMALL